MDLARIRKKISILLVERQRLEQGLLKFRRKMVKGSLFQVYTACRKGNCRCTKGQKHGPFLYMNTYIKGKLRQRYIGKKEDRPAVEGLQRYKSFQRKLEKIRAINKRLSDLWNEYRKELIKK